MLNTIQNIDFPAYYSVSKYSFFFFENLVDFNEARLHKVTLNLHTQE